MLKFELSDAIVALAFNFGIFKYHKYYSFEFEGIKSNFGYKNIYIGNWVILKKYKLKNKNNKTNRELDTAFNNKF